MICTLDEFTEKRRIEFIDEAKDMAKMYYRRYSKWPEKSLFYENFWAFEDSYEKLDERFRDVFHWVDGKTQKTIEKFSEYISPYESYEAFINHCEIEMRKEDQL